jgi:two-component system sensor histidine kinase KdpD
MTYNHLKISKSRQFVISGVSIILTSIVCYALSDVIGYKSVALILLAAVSILAIFFSIYPVLVAATLSALIWDFFFIPPHFTLHVESSEDILMLFMYFIIAMVNGVFTSKIRQLEVLSHQKEERQNTLKLYKSLFDSISHELRTPIATILGASDNLLSTDTNRLSEENKTKLTEEISVAALRLNRLIDNLLNMQRLESGFLHIKIDWCDINELIGSVLKNLQNDIKFHKIKFVVNENQPYYKLDSGLIEQALYNIVFNAVSHTPENTEITISVEYVSGILRISVSDNGKGFSPEQLQNVFKKYVNINQKSKGGMGLGLSIAKGFTEAHHGALFINNNSKGGALVILNIPTEYLEPEKILNSFEPEK